VDGLALMLASGAMCALFAYGAARAVGMLFLWLNR
jgi:hypothetical protein